MRRDDERCEQNEYAHGVPLQDSDAREGVPSPRVVFTSQPCPSVTTSAAIADRARRLPSRPGAAARAGWPSAAASSRVGSCRVALRGRWRSLLRRRRLRYLQFGLLSRNARAVDHIRPAQWSFGHRLAGALGELRRVPRFALIAFGSAAAVAVQRREFVPSSR